jgi:hypothetical protein
MIMIIIMIMYAELEGQGHPLLLQDPPRRQQRARGLLQQERDTVGSPTGYICIVI